MDTEAKSIIETLGLARHPEGGWFVETFRDAWSEGGRAHSTAIYYLLVAGEPSRWHRIDAAEVWHFYAGAPLELLIAEHVDAVERRRLGPDVLTGERPQGVAPPGAWQSAQTLGAWTLVGCTVAPGFEYSGFRMATDNEAAALDARAQLAREQ